MNNENDIFTTDAQNITINEEVITTNDDNIMFVDNIIPTATEDTGIKSAENEEISCDEGDINALKSELEALKIEFEEKKRTLERMRREIGEFSEIFPEKDVNSLPDSVWEEVKAGIPLAAAYALYERKCTIRAQIADRTNAKNSALSSGAIGREASESFFTPDEVRAMSRAEVRKNYTKIIESMKKWN